jgi:hypothetical protein
VAIGFIAPLPLGRRRRRRPSPVERTDPLEMIPLFG